MFTVWSHAFFNVNSHQNTGDQKCLYRLHLTLR